MGAGGNLVLMIRMRGAGGGEPDKNLSNTSNENSIFYGVPHLFKAFFDWFLLFLFENDRPQFRSTPTKPWARATSRRRARAAARAPTEAAWLARAEWQSIAGPLVMGQRPWTSRHGPVVMDQWSWTSGHGPVVMDHGHRP